MCSAIYMNSSSWLHFYQHHSTANLGREHPVSVGALVHLPNAPHGRPQPTHTHNQNPPPPHTHTHVWRWAIQKVLLKIPHHLQALMLWDLLPRKNPQGPPCGRFYSMFQGVRFSQLGPWLWNSRHALPEPLNVSELCSYNIGTSLLPQHAMHILPCWLSISLELLLRNHSSSSPLCRD